MATFSGSGAFEDVMVLTVSSVTPQECLRLNGPVTGLGARVCAPAEGAYLGSQHIPQGTYLLPNLYCFHHDPRVWGENVFEFEPSRFSEQADEGVEMSEKNGASSGVRFDSGPVNAQHTAWMPFGGGNRACTGKNFALIEWVLVWQRVVLAHLLRQYKVSLPSDSKHRNGIVNVGNGLVAPEAVIVNFERL
ncbi:MAG: cytochrome P450 [Olpidium bornovanus]|uniref:Cytochrome P450 n=1 Tax=Olpidium bornovanus TaxID=278681 RepID=A0A8H7ZYW0_9FUNG|nr:MAG: cytochrome P450 [Olpidium bornovanus]